MHSKLTKIIIFALVLIYPKAVFASLDTADTSWVLTSTALVLFMTFPSLALFYA